MRHLLLDPAVKREFERLRGEVEAKAREVKALQEELQAVHFSQESKSGRMLMAKCRALQASEGSEGGGGRSLEPSALTPPWGSPPPGPHLSQKIAALVQSACPSSTLHAQSPPSPPHTVGGPRSRQCCMAECLHGFGMRRAPVPRVPGGFRVLCHTVKP